MAATCPTVVTQEKVFKWWDYPLFLLLSLSGLLAIFSFLFHWFSFNDWLKHPTSFSVMTVILVVILTNNQGRWFLLPFMRRPRPMVPRPGWKVAVVTTFVPGAEPVEMLQKTVRALAGLDYPHDTWVLDEGDDENVKGLCLDLGAKHFSRKNFPQYERPNGIYQVQSKHGNYNAWLSEVGFAGYDIITIFDPDHVPTAAFLSRVLGYFEDEKVAYVQAAQAYYNHNASFIARGAAEETYAYYSSVQMASYGMGYPIIVGCHNTHRVSALREVGGFAAHDAEDLLQTLFYRASGWQGVYVPEILARGLTPVDWSTYLRQQRRWARSVLDIKFCLYSNLSKTLTLKSKLMSFLHGLNYLHRSLIVFLGLILTGFTLLTGNAPNVVSYLTLQKLLIMGAVLQLCEFYRQRFYLDRQNEFGVHWSVALLQYAKWPWFLLALLDVLSGKQKPYVLTPKVKTPQRNRLLLLPNMLVVILLCFTGVVGQILGANVHPLVYMFAAMFVVASIVLIWTDLRDFPAPYIQGLKMNATLDPTSDSVSDESSSVFPERQHSLRDKFQGTLDLKRRGLMWNEKREDEEP